MDRHHPNAPAPDASGHNWLEVVRRDVESLQFGAVEIIVHDGRVIQIDKTERLRFSKGGEVQSSESLKADTGARTAPAKYQSPNDLPRDNQ